MIKINSEYIAYTFYECKYWFSTKKGNIPCQEFIGTIEECEKYIQEKCDILGEDIYINVGADIIGVVNPKEYL